MPKSSPLAFRDTASARQNTVDLASKLLDERVAIVGVGGTGSYVLDFVSKTWVQTIHLFDGDDFLQHNAFRSPGACGVDDLQDLVPKAVFQARRYSRMHLGVEAHPVDVDETNVARLGDYDTVFLCVDGGPMKAKVLETCISKNVLLIDCGMGVMRAEGGLGALFATMRVTTCSHDEHEHARFDMAGTDGPDEYERNAQMAELNALNAALAVIKWKKARGIYNDLGNELECAYVLDGNRIINKFSGKTP